MKQHPKLTQAKQIQVGIEEIRALPQYKDLSDEQAKRILLTLRQYAAILGEFFIHQNKIKP